MELKYCCSNCKCLFSTEEATYVDGSIPVQLSKPSVVIEGRLPVIQVCCPNCLTIVSSVSAPITS